jgi:predicted ATPase
MSTLRFTRLELKSWKNFKSVDVALAQRVFVVGPNATGKSNLLLAFRFLRDVAIEGGGLAKAVEAHHGLAALRSLHARSNHIELRVAVRDEVGAGWRYELTFGPAASDRERPVVRSERVHRVEADGREEQLLDRPNNPQDKNDPERLTQTALQQVGENRLFRPLVQFLRSVSYLHIVPQLLREQQVSRGGDIGADPFGRDLLDRIRQTGPKEQKSRLRRIEKVLRIVVPQLKELCLKTDEHGKPHLECRFQHWRGVAARQNETQFSDGTLRFIGLLWSIQEPGGPLLLEEPELSLHTAIVRRLAPFIQRAQSSADGRQVILSTHSEHLLAHGGIGPEEILLVQPASEGSEVVCGAAQPRIKRLMQSGILASEAVLPESEPAGIQMLIEAVA